MLNHNDPSDDRSQEDERDRPSHVRKVSADLTIRFINALAHLSRAITALIVAVKDT